MAWLCGLVWVLLSLPALAGSGAIDAELQRKTAALERSQGPARYTALRDLWLSWERIDPTQVEAALAAAHADLTYEPALRVYAGLLEAYARRRRGDLVGATKRVQQLGYVREWLVVGPFDNENKTGFDSAAVPEQELDQPVLLDRSYQGKERAVRWRVSPDVHRYGWLDVGALLRPSGFICALATTYVRDRRAAPRQRELSLWVGASGAVKLYWNDQLVLRDGNYRQLDADRLAVAVALQPGENRLTVKVCSDDSSPTVAVRVAEPDGAPAQDIEIHATVAASTAAASRLHQRPSSAAPAQPSAAPGEPAAGASGTGASSAVWTAAGPAGARLAARGPLQQFAAELARRPEDAAVMERYARYLMITGGEPVASHQARDLARRAAELSPTVRRLLLAGTLAEDRNQQRRWVQAASGRTSSPEERVEVWLAEARLARTSPNWRDAVPLYDQVLELAPNNVDAILGKVDLYVEAGLKRTALATLERATARRPRSVALLRVLSGQLRALGRDTEAAEVEARYAALRFDDGGFIKQQIDLWAARRDDPAVRRWAHRLLESDPASAWAHGIVARAQRSLGDAAAAKATYERALAIAPDDVTSLRALSELHGEAGRRPEQVRLLERILRAQPQAKGVRAYLAHIDPRRAYDDERYAWPAARFLALRSAPDRKHPRRTLRKLTVTTLLPNGLARRFHQVVFQPLTDEAAATSRQFAFPYHGDRQTVEVRSAKVYRADGRIDEAIERGTASANDPSLRMYTLQRAYYVQFPRLEVGDVVELRYRVEDVAALGDRTDTFGEMEFLQSAEPIADVEYVLVAPKSRPLQVSASDLRGLKRETTLRGDTRITRFRARDVPALIPEPHMPPWPELAAAVHVSSFSGWRALGSWYWGLARDQLDVDDEVRRRAREVTRTLSSDREKVAAVYHHAANEIRYVALEFGIESIRPRRAALTLARGWGDCKDKATLIVAMLRELGIEAQLVLVRSGLRGRYTGKTASLAPFDHAIVWVPSLDLYLDGTAEATGTSELPPLVRKVLGLRISAAGGTLVSLPDPPASESVQRQHMDLKLAANGRITLQGSLSNRGATAPAWRHRYQAESTRRERVIRALSTDLGPVELAAGPAGLQLLDLEALEKPVRLAVQGSAQSRREGALRWVNLGPSYRLEAEYASLSKRRQELVLGPRRTLEERWTLRLPTGHRAVSLPSEVNLRSPFGSFTRTVEQTGDGIVVSSKLVLDRRRISPDDYPAWRSFARAVDGASGPSVSVAK